MPIISFKIDFPGSQGVNPRIGRLNSSDTLATCDNAGYLNPVLTAQSISLMTTDIIAVSASDGNNFYKPSIATDGTVTLVALP